MSIAYSSGLSATENVSTRSSGITIGYPTSITPPFSNLQPVNLTKEQEELLRQLDNSFRKSKSTHRPKEKTWVDNIKDFFE